MSADIVGDLRRAEIERDHWKRVAEQRAETIQQALDQSLHLLDRAMKVDATLRTVRAFAPYLRKRRFVHGSPEGAIDMIRDALDPQ